MDRRVDNIVESFLAEIMHDIIKLHIQKGQKASGETINSFEVVKKSSDTWEILARPFVGTIEEGRAPGKRPPFDAIYDWLAYRKYGLDWSTDSERRGIAYAIAKKIGEEGTQVYKQGRKSGVISSVVTEARFNEFLKDITNAYISVIFDRVVANFG